MAASRPFRAAYFVLPILVIYLCLSNIQRPTHGRNGCEYFHAALDVSRPKTYGPAPSGQAAKNSTPSVCAIFRSSCCLIQKSSLAVILICLSNDVSTNPGPMRSFPRSRGLKVAHLNIRSIANKTDSLKLLLKDKPFDILTISETWLNPNITDNEITIPGYTFARQDRDGRPGGGTLALVRDGIPYRTRTDMLSGNIESCVIEVTRPKTKRIFIFTVYRAPDRPLDSFIDDLNHTLAAFPSEAEVILLGDFNVNYLAKKTDPSHPSKQKLIRLADVHNLEQLIDQPTRITETSSTAIDLFFVNNNHRIVESGVLHVHLSDHSLIYCTVKAGVPRAPGRVIEFRSYKHYSKQLFLNDLKEAQWDMVNEEPDINVAVEIWNEIFSSIADRHAPIKKSRVKGIHTPWLTSDLTNAMQDRNYHHRKAVKTNSPYHWRMYKKVKAHVNKSIKKCKAVYYQDLINKNKGNSGELWKSLNKITSRKSSPSPSCIEVNGVSHTEPQSIAEALNNHFSTVGTKLAAKLKAGLDFVRSTPSPGKSAPATHMFAFHEVDESFVHKHLKQLKTNKAIGLDGISARMLKDSATVTTPVLTKIINRSLDSSTFPSIWKIGKVTALFKSGGRCDANNYRPITILPTVSKILEKAVHTQVYKYLNDNKILTPKQFGFRPKLSTEISLAHFTDTILGNMDKGLVTGAVYLDLSKAFDTVDHALLYRKLDLVGLSDECIDWFKSYLSNRSQVTAVASHFSSPKPVPVGVPQGSVLGPLLFLIYVNDLPLYVSNCEVSLYADDTVIHCSSTCAQDLQDKLNSDLQSLCQWFNSNLLTLNVSKCKFVVYGSPRKLNKFQGLSLTANGNALERNESFKYLGVTINQHMTWSDHISILSKKVNQRLGLICRVKHLLPLQARITLYNSLILPLLDYGDIVWGDKNNITIMDHLQVLQNNAARCLLDLPRSSSGSQAISHLNWKPLALRRRYHRCVTIFKCLNNLVAFDFNLRKNKDIHDHT